MVSNRKKIYVANISFRAEEEEIRKHIAKAGQIVEFKLIYGPDGHRGFCFVTLSSEEVATHVIEQLNGADFMGRNLSVTHARDKR